jgi:hypothetical protein
VPGGSEDGYRIIFALDVDVNADPGTIVVRPPRDDWNDYEQIRVDFAVHLRENRVTGPQTYKFFGFLGFLKATGRFSDARIVRLLLEQTREAHLEAEAVPGFFTMLPHMLSYREIVNRLGPDEARVVLRSLRDVVEAEEGPGVHSWLKSATDSLVFRKTFLRTTEAFFAWKNAGAILHGMEAEQLGRISEELRISFRLAGRPNEHQLQFQFAVNERVLPKRFAVIIGNNGVGKSQTLGRIADAAIRGSGVLTDGKGERPSFNRILAFYSTETASRVFPAPQRRRSKVWYRRFSLGGPGYGRRRQTTADLIVELARTNEQIGKKSRFEIFRTAIRAIEGYEELALPTRETEDPVVHVKALLRGGEQDKLDRFASIDPGDEVVRWIDGRRYGLSSGELSFVRFAALASLHIENSSLLLFDEPETHLHPHFISQFVMLLDSLLEQTGSAAILATHSVYFVREAFEDQVRVLRSDPDRMITVEVPVLRTFGADVGAISYFVFGEDEPSRLAQMVEKRIAGRAKSWETVFETYKDDLSLDLLGEIRAEIEDRGTAGSDA